MRRGARAALGIGFPESICEPKMVSCLAIPRTSTAGRNSKRLILMRLNDKLVHCSTNVSENPYE